MPAVALKMDVNCLERAELFHRSESLWCTVTGKKEGWAQTETQEAPSGYGENLLYWEAGRALPRLPERLWSLLLWGIENSLGGTLCTLLWVDLL